MKRSVIAAVLLAGFAGSASAATVLDFTSNTIDAPGTGLSGPVAGTTYTVSAVGGTLKNSTHWNNVGCANVGWASECDAVGNKYDVGFGVDNPNTGDNSNEIDGMIKATEYVQVTFGSLVKVLGFAGMLSYDDSKLLGTESVKLEYSTDGGLTWLGYELASSVNDDNDPGNVGDNKFTTVGLAFKKNIELIANAVRFTAFGTGMFDDGNANVTAAGLVVAPVPVPASFPLLLAGLGALGIAARRKRKSA
jgi:predicted porin